MVAFMRIAISGASGLIGRALTTQLRDAGHGVKRLVRREARAADEISWKPDAQTIDANGLVGTDAVVHLAGKPLFGRWSAKRMREIRDSRIQGTGLLARTLATMTDGPTTLVCASAIGYYGTDTGDALLYESSPAGAGFLANVVRDWEAAAKPASTAGVRVVTVRNGPVLSRHGGLLGPVLPIFRLGLGGRLGSGQQWLSWIGHEDVVGVYMHALTNSDLAGPVNAVAPEPVTNVEFTRALGKVLHRPTLIPVPLVGVRIVLGKHAADELAGASQRVSAARLLESDFRFRDVTVESALRNAVG